jgi:hypothetical protein
VRLPFGFGRRSSSADGASGVDASPASPPPASQRAWASLPPIQRTAGAMPLVAAPGTFADGLPGSQALPPIVQPLGHEVSPLATPGLVVARVRPVEIGSGASIPSPASVQRRAGRQSRSVPGAATTLPSSPEAADAGPIEAITPAAPAIAPVRSMPTVSRLSIRLPDRPLTSAASAARPAAVQRAEAATAGGDSALPRAASGGMRRVPAATNVTTSSATEAPTLSREAAGTTSAPTASASAQPPAVQGPARRGLGEPILAVPASARPASAALAPLVSSSASAGPMKAATSLVRPAVSRSTSERAPTSSPALTGPSMAASLPVAPFAALPHLPVSRSVHSGAAGTGPSPSPAMPPVQRSAVSPEIRPIAGANPIRPSVTLQRAEADDDDDAGDEDAGLPSPWWAQDHEVTAPQAHGGVSGIDGPTSIQRSATTISTPSNALTMGFGTRSQPSTAFAASGRSAIQRSATATATARTAMPVRTAIDHTHAAATVSQATIAVGSDSSPGPRRSITSDPVVQTIPAPGAAPTGSPGAWPMPSAGPSVQRAAESAPRPVTPAAPDQSATHSERDLDELAQALFGRIRGRIRSELLHDREAMGLTFDNV